MGCDTRAELPVMDAMASRLSQSGDHLDAIGKGAPGVPNAGEVAGMMGAVIAHLSDCAGDMVVGMKGAGEEVAQARKSYAAQDARAAQSLQGY
jgi:hypothetical protein